MGKNETGKAKVALIAIIIIVALITLIGAYFLLRNNNEGSSASLFSKSIKDEVVTAENYEDITDRIAPELNNEEEAYSFIYACMSYVLEDGMSVAFDFQATNEVKEAKTFSRIYGKTVKQLISEGKQLMKDNDMTVEKFKESMQNLADTTNNQ